MSYNKASFTCGLQRFIIKRKYELLLAIVIVINVVMMFYWGNMKGNFYWDEYHTYKNAHDVTGTGSTAEYIKDVFPDHTWIKCSDYQSIYIVNDEQAVSSVSDFFSHLFKEDPYPIIFNTYQSIFFKGMFSKWAGITFNIGLLILDSLLIYYIVGMLASKTSALATVILYTFSAFTISMTMFVRSYSFTIFLSIIIILLHIQIWKNSNRISAIIVNEVIMWVLAYISFLANPFAGFYAGALISVTSIWGIIEKKKDIILWYMIPNIIGALGGLYVTKYYRLFLHPKKMLEEGNLGSAMWWTIKGLTEFSSETCIPRFLDISRNYLEYMFGGVEVALILFIGYIMMKKAISHQKEEALMDVADKEKKVMGWMIFFSAALFFLIVIVFYFEDMRYYSWLYPSSIIGLVVVIYHSEKSNMGRYIIEYGIVFMAIMCSIISFLYPNKKNIYHDDKEAKRYVEMMNLPSIVMDMGYFVLQNCVFFSDDEDEIYYAKDELYDDIELPEEFLLWAVDISAYPEAERVLIEQGYEYIAEPSVYLSKIYYVSKNKEEKE